MEGATGQFCQQAPVGWGILDAFRDAGGLTMAEMRRAVTHRMLPVLVVLAGAAIAVLPVLGIYAENLAGEVTVKSVKALHAGFYYSPQRYQGGIRVQRSLQRRGTGG